MTYFKDETDKYIDYPYLIDQAMRGLVRDTLIDIEENGLPGEHHFYITFNTIAENVVVSQRILDKFPSEMTIVLQHQFKNLSINEDEDSFAVTLGFGGIPEELIIPFDSLTSFVDPSVNFGLQFHNWDTEDIETIPLNDDWELSKSPINKIATNLNLSAKQRKKTTDKSKNLSNKLKSKIDSKKIEGGAEIISLDTFRKK